MDAVAAGGKRRAGDAPKVAKAEETPATVGS
jgi:hypothetical protein